MLSNDIKIEKSGEAYKKFYGGSRGAVFQKSPPGRRRQFIIRKSILFLMVISFFIPGFTRASGQYRLLSWKGDVKIRTGGKFISLTEKSRLSLKKGDGLWLANGAEVELRFPGGTQKVVYGPRFTKVETLEKTKKGTSTLANLIKNIGIGELFKRNMEGAIGATRTGSPGLYKKIKKLIREMEEPLPDAGKEKEMHEMSARVEGRFDAAPMEKQVLIKARVFKHFKRYKLASMTVFNYYEKILNLEGKKRERNFIEHFLFNEFLPIVITFNLEDPGPITFSSNFKLWWAAFSFDGSELNEIGNSLDNNHLPQYTFKINPGNRRSKRNNPQYLFIIASYDWQELEKLNDMVEAKKELLRKDIPVTSSGKAVGLGKVPIKIRLK